MTARAAAFAGAVVLSFAAPASVDAARFAVGLDPAADRAAVAGALRASGARSVADLAPIAALAVTAPRASELRGVPGVRYVETLRSRRLSFVPNDPFFPRQWYASQNRAFDAWAELPALAPVKVAVIDSGFDGTHPELRGRIAAAKSFVAGRPDVDAQGHGTFVAGLIAAGTNDGAGIAGLAPSAQLLIAKVVGPQRSIPVEAEAKAIRWAVESGARVINMSLGGVRDPDDPESDTFSQLEADAVGYAVGRGVLVVAAVGNADQSPRQPWQHASWPAGLPHVLGVSALSRSGGSPAFSNRDPQFNDIAAPGEDILSTFPLPLTALRRDCPEQGYSSCGPAEYEEAEGTSFAAPQAAAAAAVLFATSPNLTGDQVFALLTQSAVDAVPGNGCGACAPGRDRFTGAGRLDQTAAIDLLRTARPPRDRYEPNDGGGGESYPVFGTRRVIEATLDHWNDRDDVYRVFLRRGQYLAVSGGKTTSIRPVLGLSRPGTTSAELASRVERRLVVRPPGVDLGFRAPSAGWYLLDVRLTTPSAGAYRLVVSKSR